MERDCTKTTDKQLTSISTHTLTWSVTFFRIALQSSASISTHTLTWSVTTMMPKFTIIRQISTHTLTWSVTRYEV